MYFTFAFDCLALLTHVMYLLVASEKSLAQANHVLTTMLTQLSVRAPLQIGPHTTNTAGTTLPRIARSCTDALIIY